MQMVFISNDPQLNIVVASSSLVHFVELFMCCNKLFVNFIHLPKVNIIWLLHDNHHQSFIPSNR